MSLSASSAPTDRRNLRRVLSAGIVGSTLEYYDFLLYSIASAVVFPVLFFPQGDRLVGTLVSFAGLAVGYFARPIGGLIFGHFGDRIGRRSILLITLTAMGLMSFLIGLIPSYSTIGVAAPILLVVFRIVQGIALGGEWSGATLLSFESGSSQRRGLMATTVLSGGPAGAVLANIVLAVFTLVPGGLLNGLDGWAWRIPFLLSAALVIMGLVLRLGLEDSPEYRGESLAARTASKFPLGEVLRHYPKQAFVATLGSLSVLWVQGLIVVWMINYASSLGYTETQTLWLAMIANFLDVFALLASGAISDRIGRKPVMIAGTIAGIVLIWPVFLLVQTHTSWGLLLGLLLGAPVINAWVGGPLPAWISEMFPSNARFTGSALTYQIASSLGAGLAPLVATSIIASSHGHATGVIVVTICIMIASGLAYVFSRESFRAELPISRALDLTEQAEPAADAGAPTIVR